MDKQYIPKSFPEKAVLLGGGQFANSFILVNVLEVNEVPDIHHLTGNKTILQAKVEEQRYSGIEIFEPYLWSYRLAPLNPKYADAPLDDYLDNFDGTARGQHTKHLLKA